jgi:hypothetical protein
MEHHEDVDTPPASPPPPMEEDVNDSALPPPPASGGVVVPLTKEAIENFLRSRSDVLACPPSHVNRMLTSVHAPFTFNLRHGTGVNSIHI